MNPSALPPSFLKCLSAADRKSLGKAGMTPEECLSKQEAKTERQLQTQIVNLLRLKGIEPCWHRTDKRSAATVGWPDLTFSIQPGATLWEIKLPTGKLSKEQEQMHIRLSTPPNCWRVRVIRSVDMALAELKEMGIS